MALNYAKSNTFVTGTTISSSAANQNFDDLVNIFAGLEALTKSFTSLLIDTTLRTSGTLQVPDGTAANPTIVFTADTTTGLYRIGTGNIGISTSGVKRLDISTTAISPTVPILMGGLTISGVGILQTNTANPASFGIIRLSASDQIRWRNNANNADLALQVAASDVLKCSTTLQLDGNLSFVSTSTEGVTGTTTNDSAAAGNVGEYISSSVSAAASFGGTTTQYADITSISLTAGDWDVTGQVMFVQNAATITDCACAISITAGNSSAGITNGLNQMETLAPTAAANTSSTISAYRLSLSGTTTTYLKASITFSAGTPKVLGSIHARRVR